MLYLQRFFCRFFFSFQINFIFFFSSILSTVYICLFGFECRIKLTCFSDKMKAFTVDSPESCMLVNDDNDYNANSKMNITHADKTAMSPRFVVDLSLLFL